MRKFLEVLITILYGLAAIIAMPIYVILATLIAILPFAVVVATIFLLIKLALNIF